MDLNKSLSAQAAQLQRNIANREKRRDADRFNRSNAPGSINDVYEDRPVSKRPTLPDQQLVKLSQISAQASAPVEVFPCDLCRATFGSQAQYQQHVAGPVHKKALDKLQAEQLKRQRLGAYAEVAQMALAAASWAAGQGSTAHSQQTQQQQQQQQQPTVTTGSWQGPGGGAMQGGFRGPPAASAGGRGSHYTLGLPQASPTSNPGAAPGGSAGVRGGGGRGRGGDGGVAAKPAGRPALSHEQLVALSTAGEQELTIDGWAPPIITLQTPTLPAVTAPPASVQEAVLVAAARTGPASGGDQASLPEAGAQARGVVQQQEGDLGHDDGSGSGGEGGLLGLGGYISSEDDGDADGKDGGVLAGSEGQEVGGSGLDGEAGTVGADSDDSEGQETESDEGVVAFNEGHSFF